MARVYVSSTFSDLENHRAQVRLALQRMGHEDVSMERYGAADQRPVEKCLEDVAASDVYLGIFAWHYGYVPEGYDKSITELEYRKAVEAGRECLLFLIDERADWPFNKIELAAVDRIKALREELTARHLVDFFGDESDLKALVSQALGNWEKRAGLRPARGGADWETYREAVFEAHRWVRLTVIAGAKQDRITRIPLTDVFVPQTCKPGQPLFEVPEEVLKFRRDLFEQARAADPPAGAEAAGPGRGRRPRVHITYHEPTFPEPVLDVLAREPTQVILGGPGSGKSTLMHYALLNLCDPAGPSGRLHPHLMSLVPVPFLVELRQYVLRGSPGFVEYIAANTKERYGVAVAAEEVAALLAQDGQALVIFDGLDEVFDPGARSRVIQQFESFAREYPDARVIVTSRIVGYEAAELKVAGFQHYTLLDFSVAQIRDFVPRWYQFYTWEGDERDAASLIQRIVESPRLTELAGNPLLLTMMAVIFKHQDLPEQRWKLYERCTEVLLEDWDIKRKSLELKTVLPLDINIRAPQKAEVLQRVSTYMLAHGERGKELNAIAYQPLMTILAQYLQEKYNQSPGDAEAIAKGILVHLRERTYILAEVGEGIFGFVHRTFMEYFAAAHCLAEFNARRSNYEWLTGEIFADWWRDDWQEVLRLLIGMLSDQKSPIEEVIDFLRFKCRREPPLNLAFAAKCLAEAGADAADPGARSLLNELVGELARYSETEGEEAAGFIDNGLVALSSLGPMIGSTVEAAEIIRQLELKRTLRPRMIAWQMGLALRSRPERLAFALEALRAREEAVRRGAIAALEREWPGNAEVGEALVEVVRNDAYSRVRQTAIMALQRAWPESPALLDAIAHRAKDARAYTDVIWTINYLATNWQGNPTALRLILELAADKPRAGRDYYFPLVVSKASKAIAKGWADEDDDALRLLTGQVTGSDRYVRETAARAVVEGWRNRPEVPPLLHQWAISNPHREVYSSVIIAMGEVWRDDPNTVSLIKNFLACSSDAGRVIAAVRALVKDLGRNPDVLPLVRERILKNPDDEICPYLIAAVMVGEQEDTFLFLKEQALTHENPLVRGLSLMALAGTSMAYHGIHVDKLAHKYRLPLRGPSGLIPHLARIRMEWRQQGAVLPLLHDQAVNDPSEEVRCIALRILARQRRISEPVMLLRDRAVNDSSVMVRGEALTILAFEWHTDPAVASFLRERMESDSQEQVRARARQLLQDLNPAGGDEP